MEIIRNDDGTLVVPGQPERRHESDDDADGAAAAPAATTRVLHPGEGGYDEALAARARGPAGSSPISMRRARTMLRLMPSSRAVCS